MNIVTEIKVAAPAAHAWSVIGDKFGEIGQIITGLESSFLEGTLGVGAKRTCNTKGIGPFAPASIEERLVVFDEEARRFTYQAGNGLPSIFTHAQNTWSVEATGENACVIRSHAILRVKKWLMPIAWLFPILLRKDINKSFDEVRYYIEQGEVHPNKQVAQSSR